MAQKLPSGSYRCQVRYEEGGQKKSKSFTAPTAKEAEYLALAFRLGKERSTNTSTQTVSEATEAYITNNENILSPSTIRGYRSVQTAWMTDINNVPLGRLTNDILQRWISGLAKDLSPKSVRNAWALVSAVLRTSQPNVQYKVNLPRKEKVDVLIPTDEDIATLLEETVGTPIHLPILLSAHCGLRRSEICGLKANDIDMKKRVLRVRTAVVLDEDGFYQEKAPKSYAGHRDVDMTDAVYDAFAAGETVTLDPNQITDRFARLCRRLGMPYHFHLLRHYYCSTLAMLGVPEAIAEKLCGHSSSMVHKIYVHVMDDAERKYREQIAQHFRDTFV